MSKDKKIKEQPNASAAAPRGASVASVAWGVLVFAIISLLMCAPWIRDEISLGKDSKSRKIKLSLIAPIVKISEKTHFNAPRKFVEDRAGKWLNEIEKPQTSFEDGGI
jgi:hypothetical protein